jgi:hypothetical protein
VSVPSIPRAGSIPAGEFFCTKCRLNQPVAIRTLRNNVEICKPDVNSYASLVARWKSQPPLKQWWGSLTVVQQAEWYRKQSENGFGMKRKWDSMSYKEVGSNEVVAQDFFADDWIPFPVYARNNSYLGHSGKFRLTSV